MRRIQASDITATAALQTGGGAAASSAAGRARPSGVPPRPPRDTRLDIFRGLLQLVIFASHATGTWIGVWLIPSPWGLSDSSEQFVFLSGFTLGSVFARKAVRSGFFDAWGDLLRRTWRLYRTHLLVFSAYGLAVVIAGLTILPGEAERMGWAPILMRPLAHLPRVLATLDQPAFMGILPLFVWCMLLLPGFAAVEARFGDWSLVLPLAVYVASWVVIEAVPGLGWEDGIGFNPFTWQLIFLGGAWLGRRALLHGRALPFFSNAARWVTIAAVAVLALGLWVRLGWHGFVGEARVPVYWWLADKKDLPPAGLLHALALAWLVAAFVPRDAGWMHLSAFRWIAAIGRHSLQVFCVGLFLSWGASVVFRMVPYSAGLDVMVIAIGCVGLALFARWRERRLAVARVAIAA